MRNLLLLGTLYASQTFAIQSNIKMKVYKDFFKEIVQNNMGSFFNRAATKTLTEIPIPELRTALTDA